MFKAGDKVRCIAPHNSNNLLVMSDIYTVARCSLAPHRMLHLEEFPQNKLGFFAHRFELVAEPTDQELADKFREVRKELLTIRDKLLARGCTVTITGDATEIYKSVRMCL